MVLLKDRLVSALDPTIFARAAGFEELDPWQRATLRSSSRRILLNCSRQSGKSTVSSLLAVHRACFEPGSLVLLVSPTLRQSGELFKKCVDVYHRAGEPVSATSETALALGLENGSRIVSLPGRDDASVRGYSANLLIIDEASRVPDDLYASVRPMLAVTGGRLIALSTLFGTRGWWFEACRDREGWEYHEVPATAIPRITEEFLADELRSLGRFWYEQEYLCSFLAAQTQAFSREEIEALFRPGLEEWSWLQI